MKKRAFTLIELLVVIAIIAILAAILFPVFAQAKLAAKKTVALSNAKQLATANMIYMGDYDDALVKSYFGFPSTDAGWGGATVFYSWRYAMNPYTKSKDLLADPTNPFNAKTYYTTAYSDNNNAAATVILPQNFAVNTCLIGFANGYFVSPWTPPGLDSLNTVEDVAGTILMIPNRTQWNDLKPSFIGKGEAKPDWCDTVNQTSTQACPAGNNGPIHSIGKMAAFVWADGHAKSKNVIATLDITNPTRDDWSSSLANIPGSTTQKWTQQDRKNVAANAWEEYR